MDLYFKAERDFLKISLALSFLVKISIFYYCGLLYTITVFFYQCFIKILLLMTQLSWF